MQYMAGGQLSSVTMKYILENDLSQVVCESPWFLLKTPVGLKCTVNQ